MGLSVFAFNRRMRLIAWTMLDAVRLARVAYLGFWRRTGAPEIVEMAD